ncbi:MAG: hypothetical protein ACRDNF_21795 [Streptosporangiaceae bacterium]
MDTLVRFCCWMLGGAGHALAEADKGRLRAEWDYLIRRAFSALRPEPRTDWGPVATVKENLNP